MFSGKLCLLNFFNFFSFLVNILLFFLIFSCHFSKCHLYLPSILILYSLVSCFNSTVCTFVSARIVIVLFLYLHSIHCNKTLIVLKFTTSNMVRMVPRLIHLQANDVGSSGMVSQDTNAFIGLLDHISLW